MSREAMRQALDALEKGETKLRWAAISALKQALAEPEQEPVAWGCNRYIEDDNGFPIGTDEPELAWGKYAPDDNGWWPLYTAPTPHKPQTTHWEGCEAVHPECRATLRRPLTHEEIEALDNLPACPSDAEVITFVRKIEHAHGIGEQHGS